MLKKLISLLTICAVLMSSVCFVYADEENGTIPSVVGVQLKNDDMTKAILGKAKDTGLGFVRKGIYWSTIEPVKGVYDWSKTDQWVKDIENSGFTILMTVVWNNRLYEDIYDRAIVTDEGREAFAKFASDLVSHYKDNNIIFEIWNEPNLRGFWHENDTNKSNTVEMGKEYADLIKVAVPAMKKANPDCRVAICSISCLWSDSFRWFNSVVENGGLDCGADYISVHPYGFTFPEASMMDGYPVIWATLEKEGHEEMGIINSEVGFELNYLIQHGATAENALDVQAWCFVRQNMVDRMAGIAYSNWYEFSDAQWGMIEDNLAIRPSHTAAKVLSSELNGYKYLYRVELDKDEDYALVFGNDAGEKKMVAWTSPTKAMPSDGKISVVHEVSIPVGVTGSHKITETLGKTSNIKSEDNLLKIKLSGAPVYISNVNPEEPSEKADEPDVSTEPAPTAKPSVPDEITVTLNGRPIIFDVKPQLINDRTMVPIRAIFEAMGAKVEWDDESNTAIAVKGDKTVKMTIDLPQVNVNGQITEIDMAPVLLNDRTLAPMRFVAEAFGGIVNWYEDTQTASIILGD